MKFSYKARTKEGELQVGNIESANRETAVNILLSHGLFILSLESGEEGKWFGRFLDFFRRVRANDLMIFTRQFATLLSSGVPLADSINNLYNQTTNPNLKETIAVMSDDINAGFSLSQALERFPNIFSPFFLSMVKSAEVTGRLIEVFNFLADYLEKQARVMAKVKNALIYPFVVLILFVVVVVLMVTLVLPQITTIFEESKVALPFYTKLLLGVGNFMLNWWWAVLLILFILIVMLVDYFRSAEGKMVFDEISLRLPVIGQLFQKLYIARFAESARVLIKGGLPIPQAIEIAAHNVGNYVYRDLLHEAVTQIRRGQSFAQALTSIPYFPPLVSQLVSIGEATGRLDELLLKVSDFYSREVEDMVGNLVELIQPALMILIGVLVALLFASILLPLFSLSQAV